MPDVVKSLLALYLTLVAAEGCDARMLIRELPLTTKKFFSSLGVFYVQKSTNAAPASPFKFQASFFHILLIFGSR
jgi:hypothetical protein